MSRVRARVYAQPPADSEAAPLADSGYTQLSKRSGARWHEDAAAIDMCGGWHVLQYVFFFTLLISITYGFSVIYLIQQVLYAPAAWPTISNAMQYFAAVRIGYWVTSMEFLLFFNIRYFARPLQPRFAHMHAKERILDGDTVDGDTRRAQAIRMQHTHSDKEFVQLDFGFGHDDPWALQSALTKAKWVTYLRVASGYAFYGASILTLAILPNDLGVMHNIASASIVVFCIVWMACNCYIHVFDSFWLWDGCPPCARLCCHIVEFCFLVAIAVIGLVTVFTFYDAAAIAGCNSSCSSQLEYAVAMLVVIGSCITQFLDR